MWEELSKFISGILTSNTLIANVYTFETAEYSGDPFATLTPSSNEGDYNTTRINERVYAFVIRLFKERGGATEQEDAEAAMRELVDSVLDDLDKNWRMSGLSLPTGYTFTLLEAAPSAWGYIERETGLRVAEVNVRVHFHIDTDLIS